jgi:hypothetical protein
MAMNEFTPFPKIARLSRPVVITEKLDGTNAQVHITEDGQFLTGSRNRWITPEDDNYGFSRWAHSHKEELMQLGPGSHFGEWWGAGIQRGYNIGEKRFSLFNVHRWNDPAVRPACCHVVPTLEIAEFSSDLVNNAVRNLRRHGSMAAPGFMDPEGIIIYHTASKTLFKKTLTNDEAPKTTLRPR